MVTFFVIIISVPPFLENSISWMSGFLEVSRYSHAIYSSHIRSCDIILWIFKTSIIKISKFSKALLGPFWPNNHNFPSLCTTSEYFKSFFQRKTFWDQITDKIYGDSLKVMQVFCYDTANLYLSILHTGWFWKTKLMINHESRQTGVDEMAEVLRHFFVCYSKPDVCLFKLNVCWSKKKNSFLLCGILFFLIFFISWFLAKPQPK